MLGLIIGVPLSVLYLVAVLVVSVFGGLPIAAIKFIVTGSSGIEWYLDTVIHWVLMNHPIFLWGDSIERRHAQTSPRKRATQ